MWQLLPSLDSLQPVSSAQPRWLSPEVKPAVLGGSEAEPQQANCPYHLPALAGELLLQASHFGSQFLPFTPVLCTVSIRRKQ